MTPFVNEVYADFSAPEVWAKAEAALALVRSQLGRDYDLWIAGAAHRTGDLLEKSRDLFEKGRKVADDAAELFEKGRSMVKG